MSESVPHRTLVVTQGDPDGVGLELILAAAQHGDLDPGDLVVADRVRLRERALALGLEDAWASIEGLVEGDRGLTQVQALERGVDLVLADPDHRALVTAPIDKSVCQQEGFRYPGHTEYLAARAGGCPVAMLMAGPTLKVVLATVHIALRDVPERLTEGAIVQAASLLADALIERFGITCPRVGVLGLNPHAGEQGLLGQEEQTVIAPAMAVLRSRYGQRVEFEGPLPADTAFPAHRAGRFDGVVAMYHDQGLGPFKLIHFHDGVNVTLGLPFVRTSPDHGTAKDIAGKGIADPSSMRAAIALARESR